MTGRAEAALAIVLLAGGAISFALHQWVFVDPTHPTDWQRGAAWVVEHTGPRDAVRIEPFWYESALVHLQPVGDRVQRIRDPLLEDVYQIEHMLILSQADRLDAALASLPFKAAQLEVQHFDTVAAARVTVPEHQILWELYDALADARVSRVKGDEVEVCDRWNPRTKRWDCAPADQWTYVGQEEREVGDDPRRCVWAHPLDRGRTLRIDATVPASATIRVRDSFDLRAARLGGAPVLVQIFVNDVLEVEDRVAGDDQDWQAHDIDVRHIDGPAQLRIEVDLLGPIKNRFLCLNAWALQ